MMPVLQLHIVLSKNRNPVTRYGGSYLIWHFWTDPLKFLEKHKSLAGKK